MPLEELEKLKALRVKMVKANTELVRLLTVRLAPTATIADLLDRVCPSPKLFFRLGVGACTTFFTVFLCVYKCLPPLLQPPGLHCMA